MQPAVSVTPLTAGLAAPELCLESSVTFVPGLDSQLLTQPQTWLSGVPQEQNPVTHWEPQRDQLCAVNPVAHRPVHKQLLSTALSGLCTGDGGVRN